MSTDENHDAGPSAVLESPSNSNHDASSGRFLPSAKLREKLSKLADRRIDISSIEFPNDARKFSGASATVSQAFLLPPSGAENVTGQTSPTKDDGLNVPGPAGEASPQRKAVAVKKMKISGDPARVLGLTLREAEFLVGLSHENIIKLEGFVEDLSKDVVWLVFPWEENGTLKDFIASAEWEIPERIWLIDDVARGVKYLHDQQPPIRHGDLKSINILVNSEFRAVITDFGSARHQITEEPDKETSQPGNKPQPALSVEATTSGPTNTLCITLTGDHYTLRWAAPELLNEERATLACDIWALGFVMYEVMTNSIPFQDVINDNAVIVRVVRGDLPSVADNARMLLIQALCSLMLACWSIDPEKRPTAGTCRKSINWMPMIKPSPIRTADVAASRARSPALLMQLGDMYRRQGDYLNASDLFTKALDGYREIGNNNGKATALVQLAQLHRFQDQNDMAVTYYSEALKILTKIGDRKGRADALWGLAEVHRLRNEYIQAITFYSEALDICTDIGHMQGRASALWGLAEVHRLRDEYSQAVTFYSEALDIYTDIGNREGRADALLGLAGVHRRRKEYSQAIKFYSEALDISTDVGHRMRRADILQGLAEVHRLQNEYSQAIKFYSEALNICTDIGDRSGRAFTLRSLARVHQPQNEYSQAITLFSEALEISSNIGDRYGRAQALLGLADVHRDQGNYRDAIGPYTEAAEIFEQIGETQNAAYASNQAAKREKLSKLADRRIDISSIEFPNEAHEFSGASATVSRAFLVTPSGAENTSGQPNRTRNKDLNLPGPAGEPSPQRKAVAVKKMKISNDPARVLGLTLREAEFLVGLSHVNIIELEGLVEDLSKDVVWLVFPWEENGTLKDFIASAEWEIPERIWLISDVADGVEYLHDQQPPIRHGDLKSINILVNSEFRAVITDFGSARHEATDDSDKEASQAGNKPQLPALSLEATTSGPTNTLCITLTGNHYTLRWAAPELLNEEKATLACDIWALGFVMYEVMTNSIPFHDVINENAVIVRVVRGDLPSVADNARMLLIQALCSLMLACWSINPEKRPTAGTCRKSINCMPMIKPSPIRTADAAASRARSPALLIKLGDMYQQQDDYLNASDFFTKALDGYSLISDNEGKAAALDRLAEAHRLRSEFSQAITFYSKSLDIRTDIGDRQGRADALWGLAEAHRFRSEYSQAIKFYSEALDIRTSIGDKPGRASALWGLADVHRLQGEYTQAIAMYSEALDIRTSIGDKQGRASALWGLGQVHQRREEYSQAITMYSEALDIRTDLGHRRGRADALQGLANVHRLRNEYSQAIAFYSEALDICTDIGDKSGRAFTLRNLARVYRSQNNYGQAITLFSEALEIDTDIGDRYGRAHSLLGLADAHRDQGNYGDAIGPYTKAAEVFEQIGATRNAAYASNQAAKVRQLSLGEEAT